MPQPSLSDDSAALLVVPNTVDAQQLRDLLEFQIRLRHAAQRARDTALRGLIELAEALCVTQWDEEKRQGRNPEQWLPERIITFIKHHATAQLRQVDLSKDTRLLEKYENMAREHTQIKAEASRLQVLVETHETTITALGNKIAESNAEIEALKQKLAQASAGAARPAAGVVLPAPAAPTDLYPGTASAGTPSLAQPAVTGEAAGTRAAQDEAPGKEKYAFVPEERVNELLKLVAATGLTRNMEISKRLAKMMGHSDLSGARKVIAAAEERGLLKEMAYSVKWGGGKRNFVRLTDAGKAHVRALGVEPVAADEYELGLQKHKDPLHLLLVLETADVLAKEGYDEVNVAPDCITVGEGQYCPDIAARENGRLVYFECESGSRSQHGEKREAKWRRAAEANGGSIKLACPNQTAQSGVIGEINLVLAGQSYTLMAFNLTDYAANKRGANSSIYTFYKKWLL